MQASCVCQQHSDISEEPKEEKSGSKSAGRKSGEGCLTSVNGEVSGYSGEANCDSGRERISAQESARDMLPEDGVPVFTGICRHAGYDDIFTLARHA